MILEAGSDVVRFETHVDWHEKHRMLRAEFFPTHYGDDSAVRDPVRPHRPRRRPSATRSRRRSSRSARTSGSRCRTTQAGFALLNDSKYGHRAKDGLLSLNLLRSPTFPDKTADRGIHEFTYAFTPFAAGDLATVIAEGYRLNNPLLVDRRAQRSRARPRRPATP